MTAKQYLKRAWNADRRIDRLIEERDRLQSALTRGVGQLTGMPKGGGQDWTNAALKVVELSGEINREIEDLCRAKREVSEAIAQVEDARARRVLELRYRSYMSWAEIAQELHYSDRWVFLMHGIGLKRVKEFIEFQY